MASVRLYLYAIDIRELRESVVLPADPVDYLGMQLP